jgi:hypothetical protein
MATSNVSAADLRSKKSFTSPIWQYFGFKTDEDDNAKPTCKLCVKKVSAAGGNTSNLQVCNGISAIIILRRHKSSGNKVDKITIIELYRY